MSIDYQLLLTGNPTVNKDNWRDFYKVVKPIEMDFAEAVTCHKYQGSQADKVVVFCEPMGDKEQYFRWLYTAATRSAKKLVMVI
jgi:ATP-dependent exoDNAse (exonuclease V) alpha subunit